MDDLKNMEKTLKALANKRRLAITIYLKDGGEASVSEISKALKISFKATSKHLRVLASADIVEKEQKLFSAMYRLCNGQKPAAQVIIKLL